MSPRKAKPKNGQAIQVTVKKSFTKEFSEDDLEQLVKAALPAAVQKLPGLQIKFYGEEYSSISCTVSWESTSTSEEVF